MHSILGDSCHEPTAVEAILRHNFDLERAIDQVLGGGQYSVPISDQGDEPPLQKREKGTCSGTKDIGIGTLGASKTDSTVT